MSVLVTDKGFQPLPELPGTGVADLAIPTIRARWT